MRLGSTRLPSAAAAIGSSNGELIKTSLKFSNKLCGKENRKEERERETNPLVKRVLRKINPKGHKSVTQATYFFSLSLE
jgi:hypothetical protein